MTTKIAVISDTHCYRWEDVHPALRIAVRDSDISVHCGDIVRQDVVDGFRRESKHPIIVHGNSDPVELRESLPYTEIIKVEGILIAAIHPAWGGPEFPPEELLKDFTKKPDVILFGHTHEPLNKEMEGVLFVNPGQGYKSFMVDCTMAQLTVNSGNITAEIVVIEKGRSY